VYSVEMIGLAMKLLGFMAADLGVEREALVGAFTGRRQSMAIHYYPPCPHREKVMGITPHTDGLGLTLLLHVDGTPGLQIRKGGRWFPVRPLPGAFVVNVADILDVLSNGTYRSVEHRVIPDAERARTTVARRKLQSQAVVEARGTAHQRGQPSRRRNPLAFRQLFLSKSAPVKRGLKLGGPPSKAKYF
jgi:isopenicillin N synthase-like dioxygenase